MKLKQRGPLNCSKPYLAIWVLTLIYAWVQELVVDKWAVCVLVWEEQSGHRSHKGVKANNNLGNMTMVRHPFIARTKSTSQYMSTTRRFFFISFHNFQDIFMIIIGVLSTIMQLLAHLLTLSHVSLSSLQLSSTITNTYICSDVLML